MSITFWLLTLAVLLGIWFVYRLINPPKPKHTPHEKKHNTFRNAQNLLKTSVQKEPKPLQPNYSPPKENEENQAILNSLNNAPPSILLDLKIIEPGMIDEETFAYTSKIIDSIKRPHPALHSLTANISPEELIDIVQGCPDITAKILTTVNSASFGLLAPITSVNHAVIYLGLGIVKSITLQFMIKDSLNENTPEQSKAYKKLWSASYLNSSLSFLLAHCLSNPHAAELSTKALLDGVGCFALLSFDKTFAELYLNEPSLLNRTLCEQEKHGVNASVIGYYLSKKWQLPTIMNESISKNFLVLQYEKNKAKRGTQNIQDLVFCYFMGRLANHIVYHGLEDINDFDLNACHQLDYFYVQQALQENNLNMCLSMMKTATFIKKANKLIQQIH